MSRGIRVLRAYTYPTLHRSFVWRVISFLSFMLTAVWAGWKAGKVDVVMGTSPPLTQPLSAWAIAVLRRRPFLLEIRDLWPEFAIDMGVLRNPVLIWVTRRLEMFLYRRATHLLVNSPAYRDYLISKGVPPQKVSLIANGVDPTLFDPAAKGQGVRDEFHLDNKFVVTYAGAIGMANDIGTILNAADLLRDKPEIHFLLAGDGKERTNMQAQASQRGLNNVTFTGALPKGRMPEVLAASDVCVATLKNIPMFTTTYPNKIFDYMAAGRPTVLAIDGVIREVVEVAGGGIFSYSRAIHKRSPQQSKHCYADRNAAREMGLHARQHVEQYFHRHRQAVYFEQLVSRLAEGNALSPVDSQCDDEVPEAGRECRANSHCFAATRIEEISAARRAPVPAPQAAE